MTLQLFAETGRSRAALLKASPIVGTDHESRAQGPYQYARPIEFPKWIEERESIEERIC
jgi:hypothetical protein